MVFKRFPIECTWTWSDSWLMIFASWRSLVTVASFSWTICSSRRSWDLSWDLLPPTSCWSRVRPSWKLRISARPNKQLAPSQGATNYNKYFQREIHSVFQSFADWQAKTDLELVLSRIKPGGDVFEATAKVSKTFTALVPSIKALLWKHEAMKKRGLYFAALLPSGRALL